MVFSAIADWLGSSWPICVFAAPGGGAGATRGRMKGRFKNCLIPRQPFVPERSRKGDERTRRASYGLAARFVQALFAIVVIFAAQPGFARTLKLVALGDSLTAGYGLKAGEGFTDVLARALKAAGFDVEVINAGVSGDTAEDGLARYDWSVPKDADALIVELGANDMLRGVPVASAKAALAEIVERAKAAHLPVLLAGMRAVKNFGADYQKNFDAIYPDLAAQYGVALYPFFLDGLAGDASLNQPDGLHPNARGVETIVARILPAAEGVLKSVAAK